MSIPFFELIKTQNLSQQISITITCIKSQFDIYVLFLFNTTVSVLQLTYEIWLDPLSSLLQSFGLYKISGYYLAWPIMSFLSYTYLSRWFPKLQKVTLLYISDPDLEVTSVSTLVCPHIPIILLRNWALTLQVSIVPTIND